MQGLLIWVAIFVPTCSIFSDCCHSRFEAIEDRSLLSKADRVKVLRVVSLHKMWQSSVLLDLDLVLVDIPQIMCSNHDNCDLLWADHDMEQRLFFGFALRLDSTFFATKITCGEAHHPDVLSHLQLLLWCSAFK